MSQVFSGAGEVPLFACTKCNSRHPFEDLSQGHQLCKDCKGSFQVVKCNYCRSEFQQETGTKSSSICKKCEHLQDQHGKPGPCAYCNIIAAFIGTKCQRCTNSEKKYGAPMSCEHCRQKCAFDRKDPESKKKVDGKLLCWLCTMAYKRTIAKAKQKEAMMKGSYSSGTHHRLGHSGSRGGVDAGGDPKSYSSSSSNRNHGQSSTTNGSSRPGGSNGQTTGSSSSSSMHRSSSHRHSQSHNSSHSNHKESSSSSSSANKKARIDLSNHSSNGHLSTNTSSMSSSMSDNRFLDPNNTELNNVVTQLKDQLAVLNKRLQMKEKELLQKDQQIAILTSQNKREERELREKMNIIQKQHDERISEMQAKLIAMQKQIVSQNKASRTNPTPGYVEPPLVI